MTPARRNAPQEKAWLRRAAADAGAADFADHAIARLEDGAVAYGDRWAELGIGRLVTELVEEAADLGAWGVLAFQALELEGGLNEASRVSLGGRLHAAILAVLERTASWP